MHSSVKAFSVACSLVIGLHLLSPLMSPIAPLALRVGSGAVGSIHSTPRAVVPRRLRGVSLHVKSDPDGLAAGRTRAELSIDRDTAIKVALSNQSQVQEAPSSVASRLNQALLAMTVFALVALLGLSPGFNLRDPQPSTLMTAALGPPPSEPGLLTSTTGCGGPT